MGLSPIGCDLKITHLISSPIVKQTAAVKARRKMLFEHRNRASVRHYRLSPRLHFHGHDLPSCLQNLAHARVETFYISENILPVDSTSFAKSRIACPIFKYPLVSASSAIALYF